MAEAAYRQALDILSGRGMDEIAAWALSGLGHAALIRGDLLAARRYFEDMVLRRVRVFGALAHAASGFVPHIAALFAAEGRHELAARLLGAAAAARDRLAFPALYLKDRAANNHAMEAVRRALGDEGFAQAWATGAATPMDVLVGEVQEVLRQPPG